MNVAQTVKAHWLELLISVVGLRLLFASSSAWPLALVVCVGLLVRVGATWLTASPQPGPDPETKAALEKLNQHVTRLANRTGLPLT